MNVWKVLKARGAEFDRGEVTTVYATVGEIESKYSYSPPSAQQIGELFGVGSFLLLEAGGGGKYVETTIETDKPTFVEIDNVGDLDRIAA